MSVFERVLVAVDGSACSAAAMARAMAIADDQQADVHFVHVIERSRLLAPFEEAERALRAAGEMLLDQAVDAARDKGLLATSALLVTDSKLPSVAGQILKEADAFDADLIICGTHGIGGFKAALLGSVANELACKSTVSLLLERSIEGGAA